MIGYLQDDFKSKILAMPRQRGEIILKKKLAYMFQMLSTFIRYNSGFRPRIMRFLLSNWFAQSRV